MEGITKPLAEVLQYEDGTNVNDMIAVKVVEVLPVFQYTRQDKTTNTMFTAAICDGQTAAKLLVYDKSKTTTVTKNSTLYIIDFVTRERQVVATSKTKMFRAPKELEVPEDKLKAARALVHDSNAGQEVTILDASRSPKKTVVTVKGIIYKVGPLEKKTVRASGEEVDYKKVKINDETSKIPVVLWRDLARQPLQRNDIIRCINFSVSDTFDRRNKSIPSVTNRSASAVIEYVAAEGITPENSSDEEQTNPTGTLLSMADLKHYRSCQNSSCFNRKLRDDRCPSCGVFYRGNAASTAYIGQLLIHMPTTHEVRTFTVFTQQLSWLATKLDVALDENFETTAAQKLPIQITFQFQ